MASTQWYALNQPEKTDSPALLVYPERIKKNIQELIRLAGRAGRLVVHVKTHKMPEVVRLQLQAGIHRFKCATVAEAEMLADSGAGDILLAYQLNTTKARRFLALTRKYPDCSFSSLVDNPDSAIMLNKVFGDDGQKARVYIDIDNGMHRTGISVSQDIPGFYKQLSAFPNLKCLGLHVYDGHLHIRDFQERKRQTIEAFAPVKDIVAKIETAGLPSPEIIAGGSPTFPVHAENPRVLCSPGTNVLWDAGYAQLLPEQHFLWAAVLLTRIISKPSAGIITTDLGHKSVAAENPLDKRISFLNLSGYKPVSQSEEHLSLAIKKEEWDRLKVGDALYGIPYHICPTVALYDETQVVADGTVVGQWQVLARKKKITI